MVGEKTMEEQLPPARPRSPTVPAQPVPTPAPVQPIQTPQPTTPVKPIPTKPLIAKPAPIKPPIKPSLPPVPEKPSLPPVPIIPTTPLGEPKKSILTKWWVWIIVGVIILGAITGIFFLASSDPFGPKDSSTQSPDEGSEGDDQSQTPDPGQADIDLELEIFTCEEIVQMNKEIIDQTCEEDALFEVVVGMDYISTVYADSEEDACINGPTELIAYVNSTCGEESLATLLSLAVIELKPIEELNTSDQNATL